MNQVLDQVRAIEQDFKDGLITADELKELLEDIKHTSAIEAAAGDLAALTQINTVINGVIAAAGAV
jgi:hypothetical protein